MVKNTVFVCLWTQTLSVMTTTACVVVTTLRVKVYIKTVSFHTFSMLDCGMTVANCAFLCKLHMFPQSFRVLVWKRRRNIPYSEYAISMLEYVISMKMFHTREYGISMPEYVMSMEIFHTREYGISMLEYVISMEMFHTRSME